MCGIAGLIGYKGDQHTVIKKMNDRMFHRGPDDGGSYIDEGRKVALGHRRLAIVDLSKNGAQPFVSASKKSVMVYNGEIYNAGEIKEKLMADAGESLVFRSTSDTEILLEAIERYGAKEALSMCKGMFGLAVYDKEAGTVTLARDRVGEKPLYYGTVAGSFAFASDIGCLRQIDGFDNAINEDVLDIYFEEGYIPAPYSIYENIYKLDPGKILTVDVKTLKTTEITYWSMKDAAKKGQKNLFTGSFEEASMELERLLKESIKGQMIADVPLGAFLSAGIDSSTVVSLMQAISPGKVRTFTIGMEDEKYNEAVYAKEIAAHLGTEHTEKYITEKDAKEVIPKLSFMFGEPFADSSQIPTFLVSQMTREHVTVSLSGDGGDELFCGYRSYQSLSRVWNKVKKIPYPVRKLASGIMLASPMTKDEVSYTKSVYLGAKSPYELHRMEREQDDLTKRIAKKKGRAKYKGMELPAHFLGEVNHEAMLLDMIHYHPDDILVKVDRTAMAVSLETRVPMLDRDVMEFAWSLPIEYLREGDTGKRILRDVLYRYVPKEMMERPKKGFSIPISKWLLDDDLRDWAEELLDKKKIEEAGILDADVVEKIWRDFTERGKYRIQIWYILMFQMWYETEGPGAKLG
ncbi:asparagine synthase (glutamine-hydrolyzing) [Butyrivibrio sp. CB08]|uniref:asparagine synthase (glutamine-hydrolyzing) n=1 Tax=Butyrivibrio sp. CB08 TaxID=2364879 RepID=UPI000EA9B22C|nr:asparagine synthase (glutamine-hydrolyzing) [Butyrivibrio sp. CB08]RKM59801.1 asparagine synthase (glutamine-hydrolyzing) [Butyrivibrio sp. CB08]